MEGDTKQKPQVLRAQDIIPSAEPKLVQGNSTNGNVPRFDLATEIMAQQRKLTSSRRKRAENQVQPAREDFQTKLSTESGKTFSLPSSVYASLIAEIVKRDIQRMLLTHNGPRG